jgi:hypothetical protein
LIRSAAANIAGPVLSIAKILLNPAFMLKEMIPLEIIINLISSIQDN